MVPTSKRCKTFHSPAFSDFFTVSVASVLMKCSSGLEEVTSQLYRWRAKGLERAKSTKAELRAAALTPLRVFIPQGAWLGCTRDFLLILISLTFGPVLWLKEKIKVGVLIHIAFKQNCYLCISQKSCCLSVYVFLVLTIKRLPPCFFNTCLSLWIETRGNSVPAPLVR